MSVAVPCSAAGRYDWEDISWLLQRAGRQRCNPEEQRIPLVDLGQGGVRVHVRDGFQKSDWRERKWFCCKGSRTGKDWRETPGTHKGLARPTTAHEPKGKREGNCAGDLGMTPGHSCAGPLRFRPFLPHQQEAGHRMFPPWRQSALGLMRWARYRAQQANHAVLPHTTLDEAGSDWPVWTRQRRTNFRGTSIAGTGREVVKSRALLSGTIFC